MLQEITIRTLKDSPVRMFAEDWALLTAGTPEDFNTMTVSWGGVGELWGKDVAMAFVRPQRYTKEFMEKQDSFTLSFFDGEYKKELTLCGKESGRDIDKVEATGFTPIRVGENGVSFQEAKKIIVCKKAALWDMTPEGFLNPEIEKWYLNKDYHRMYVGTIENVFISDDFTKSL